MKKWLVLVLIQVATPAIVYAYSSGSQCSPFDGRLSPREESVGQINLYNSHHQLTGRILQLYPGYPFYMAARHSLQGLSKREILTSLNTTQNVYSVPLTAVDPFDWQFFEFRDQSRSVDAILIGRSFKNAASANFEDSLDILLAEILANSRPMQKTDGSLEVQPGDPFYFLRFGLDQSPLSQGEQIIGRLSHVEGSFLWIPVNGDTNRYSGTSGGFLMTRAAQSSDCPNTNRFALTGLVLCHVSERPWSLGLGPASGRSEGFLKVISIETLARMPLRKIPVEAFEKEKPDTSRCKPVDRRGAGGD